MSNFSKQTHKSSQSGRGNSVFPDSKGNSVSSSLVQHSCRPANTQKAAFTLIEVLIAMFVSVMAVSSTYLLLTYSRDILRSSSNRIDALNNTRGAIEHLRTLEFDSDELKTGTHSLTLENGQTFSYNVAVYESEDDLKQITVQSDWTSEVSDSVRQVELVSIISAPLHTE
ncbi:prepilin-type N-terminal cleavage/methylation domain-containing protein [Pontiellaceae bacterium B1224]|nr:prepilin-type N-terminal cleavage/methylation domain-containing protein [Pontiellaceae bacterium B1224]